MEEMNVFSCLTGKLRLSTNHRLHKTIDKNENYPNLLLINKKGFV